MLPALVPFISQADGSHLVFNLLCRGGKAKLSLLSPKAGVLGSCQLGIAISTACKDLHPAS